MKTNPKLRRKRIAIIGGGVSGASLAIRLATEDIDVLLVERDKFPRHKLCGEFVSPECLVHFEKLGVIDAMTAIGGDTISETRFFSKSGRFLSVPSDWFLGGARGALGISRAEMDFRMLERAKELGVKVFEETKCASVDLIDERISCVFLTDKRGLKTKLEADLFVDATGRSKVLGNLIQKSLGAKQKRGKIKHVGFKAHYENVNLDKGVCEIYFFRGGYGGLSYVENGSANHCFLIDSKVAREFKGDADAILENVIFKNARAYKTLKKARKKFDWLGVSVEKFGKQDRDAIENLISVGDAAAFIDPFTGSGMLMALESSELLAETLAFELEAIGHSKIATLKTRFEKAHEKAIRRRLRACSMIHRLSFSPRLAGAVIAAGSFSNTALKAFASSTRPTSNARS